MGDSRKATRRPVRHGSWIFVGANTPLIPCMLLDVSNTGARVKIDPATELPTDFILILSRDKRLNRRCRMIWRDEGMVGASFSSSRSMPTATSRPALNLEAIKEQIVRKPSDTAKSKSPASA